MRKQKVCVMTATRAEYGLLRPLIQGLLKEEAFEVEVVVTGMHLSSEFGFTYQEIEEDKIPVTEKIPIVLSTDSPAGISKSMGLAMIGFGDYFERSKPDMLVVLGDRYEAIAVCLAAVNARIPVVHLHGGETTEGAIDELYRHAITKMSYLHFASTAEYAKRIVQMGEHPSRVYNVGALGVENAKNVPLLTKQELEESIHFHLEKSYVIVTFHPVTMEENTAEAQIEELLCALHACKDINIIFTKANADASGRVINQRIDEFVAEHSNSIAVYSLGYKRYLSALKYCDAVIGNSSSGIIEAPSFGIPVINIGDRQKGRIQAECIINCEPEREDIGDAIRIARSKEYRTKAKQCENPYGNGETSTKIVKVLKEHFIYNDIDKKKVFYTIQKEE